MKTMNRSGNGVDREHLDADSRRTCTTSHPRVRGWRSATASRRVPPPGRRQPCRVSTIPGPVPRGRCRPSAGADQIPSSRSSTSSTTSSGRGPALTVPTTWMSVVDAVDDRRRPYRRSTSGSSSARWKRSRVTEYRRGRSGPRRSSEPESISGEQRVDEAEQGDEDGDRRGDAERGEHRSTRRAQDVAHRDLGDAAAGQPQPTAAAGDRLRRRRRRRRSSGWRRSGATRTARHTGSATATSGTTTPSAIAAQEHGRAGTRWSTRAAARRHGTRSRTAPRAAVRRRRRCTAPRARPRARAAWAATRSARRGWPSAMATPISRRWDSTILTVRLNAPKAAPASRSRAKIVYRRLGAAGRRRRGAVGRGPRPSSSRRTRRPGATDRHRQVDLATGSSSASASDVDVGSPGRSPRPGQAEQRPARWTSERHQRGEVGGGRLVIRCWPITTKPSGAKPRPT